MSKDKLTKIIDGIAAYTLKGVEEAIFSWSSIAFAFLSVASFFSIFLFGFFRKIVKGILPVIDTSIAASISLQFTLFLAACGMIIRVAPYLYAALLLFFKFLSDDENMLSVRYLSFAIAYLIATPGLLFAAFAAFLDAQEAAGMLPAAIFLAIVIASGLYVAERRRSSNSRFTDVLTGVKQALDNRTFFTFYKSFPALVAVCALVFSFLLGGAKFIALSHQSNVFVIAESVCFSLPLLGATSSGVLLIDGIESVSIFGNKHRIVFLPFSGIDGIIYYDGDKKNCKAILAEMVAPNA